MSVSNESRQLNAQFFSILCSANKKDIWFADLSVFGESDGTILSKQGY